VAQPGAGGFIADQLAGTRVFFNGIPSPVLYASSQQINAQVPWELTGAMMAQVQVSSASGSSNTAAEQIQSASPALFHIPPANASVAPPFPGAILNQDGSLNAASNPAARGSVVMLFGTGGGATAPPGITGALAPSDALGLLTLPVMVQIFEFPAIGLQPLAPVLYAGPAPTLNSGVFQINIQVPSTATPGINVVSLTVAGFGPGPFSIDQSALVTIAVK
jgi:uncharacterized protein (TIGR03437 family)